MGLATLIAAVVMVIHRPAFTDLMVWLVLWLGSPGTMCIAGLVIWSYRKEKKPDPGLSAQRMQCKVAIALALAAAAIVYLLVIKAQRVPAGLLD